MRCLGRDTACLHLSVGRLALPALASYGAREVVSWLCCSDSKQAPLATDTSPNTPTPVEHVVCTLHAQPRLTRQGPQHCPQCSKVWQVDGITNDRVSSLGVEGHPYVHSIMGQQVTLAVKSNGT